MSPVNLLPRLKAVDIATRAALARKGIEEVCIPNNAGHIAPSFSCIEILSALYYGVMRLSSDPQWDERDRLVFSKAHGGYGLYAILSDIGYIPASEWKSFYAGGSLAGCVERRPEYGLEASCGALGHGLPMAAGMAYAAKLQKKCYRIFCIVGDGEMQEGSNWEAIQFAVKYRLDNLVIIIDANGLQAMDSLQNILSTGDVRKELANKTRAFGCRTVLTDGHDIRSLKTAMSVPATGNKPRVVIARTVKGYGMLCMENVPKFHFRIPTQAEMDQGRRYE